MKITTLAINHYVSYDFVPSGYGPMAAAVTGSGSQQNICPARLTGTWQKTSDSSETLTIIGYDSYNRRNRTQTYGPYGLMQDDVTWYDLDGSVDSAATTVRRIPDQGVILCGTLHNHYFDIPHTRVLQSSDLSVTDAAGHTQDRTIRSLGYDALGRVTSNDRGHNAVSMTYQYNPLRGWLTQIFTADNGFRQKLMRESGTTSPLSNGSISAMIWKVPDDSFERKYDYTYDGLNRLTEGAYFQSLIKPVGPVINDSLIVPGPFPGGITPLSLIPVIDSLGVSIRAIDRYTERISYDKNSNIIGIERYGMNNLHHYSLIDDLTFTYTGNQRRTVTDDAGSLTYTGASDFVDGTNLPQEYTYDGNGRLTMDTNRGIASISYDLCNNPQAIAFTGTNGIEYVYAPDGTRLRTVYKVPGIGGSVTRDTTDYYGNLVMRNGHLSMYQFDGGYVSFNNDTIDGWHYCIRDYMGNNRVVVNGNSTIEQVTHYYPYGGVIGNISTNESVQKYKFEGKELDRTFGLDNYDIHARQYFAMAPMWDKPDSKAEEYYHLSPYVYCGGDPVNQGDYNGRNTVVIMTNSNLHIALLVQDDDKQYRYYSINGKDYQGIGEGHSKFDNLGEKSFSSVDDFFNSPYNTLACDNSKLNSVEQEVANGYHYTVGFELTTSPEQDAKIAEKFKEMSETTNYALSSIGGDNCATTVNASLRAGGVITGCDKNAPSEIVPAFLMDNIQKNNPNGIAHGNKTFLQIISNRVNIIVEQTKYNLNNYYEQIKNNFNNTIEVIKGIF